MASKNHDLSDVTRASARELSQALHARTLSPRDLLEATLARIDKINPALNAIIHLDVDGSRNAAQESEKRYRDGLAFGPLDGIPLTIKDNLLVGGMPATWGSPIFADFVPEADELPVARLRKSGAVILGKTNVPEFTLQGYTDNALFGPTRNPWNLELTPGGSSGGAVSAVASGLGPLAIGTDGGGSTRRPAALTGLVGFKPSVGKIARGNGFPAILYDFESIGLIARTVEDAEMLFNAVAGPDTKDRRSLYRFRKQRRLTSKADESSPRILYIPHFGAAAVDTEVSTGVEEAAKRMADLGYWIEEGDAPFDIGLVNECLKTVFSTGLAALLKGRNWSGKLNDSLASLLQEGLKASGVDYFNAIDRIWQFRATFSGVFDRYDLLLTPSSAAMPWPAEIPYPVKIDGREAGPRDHAAFTGFANMAGLPGISLPTLPSPAGMPIGFQLVGEFDSDLDLLSTARQYETAYPWKATSPFGY